MLQHLVQGLKLLVAGEAHVHGRRALHGCGRGVGNQEPKDVLSVKKLLRSIKVPNKLHAMVIMNERVCSRCAVV